MAESSTPIDTPYLTPEEAAAYVRLAPSTLAKLRITGGGPRFAKPNRNVVYTRPDLDEWMLTHRFEMTSDPAYPQRQWRRRRP